MASQGSFQVNKLDQFGFVKKSIRRYTFLWGARVALVSTRHTKNYAVEFLIISAIKLSSFQLVLLQIRTLYIAGSSAIALESCYMFTKNVVNMFTVLDMILIGLMIMYDQEY